MPHAWLQEPIAQDLLLATAVLGILTLWYSSRLSFRKFGRGLDTSRAQVEVTLQGLSSEVAEVRSALQREVTPVARPVNLQAVNLTTRAQILRMHRRGTSPAEISGVVGMPQNEVALLLKLERLSRPRA